MNYDTQIPHRKPFGCFGCCTVELVTKQFDGLLYCTFSVQQKWHAFSFIVIVTKYRVPNISNHKVETICCD